MTPEQPPQADNRSVSEKIKSLDKDIERVKKELKYLNKEHNTAGKSARLTEIKLLLPKKYNELAQYEMDRVALLALLPKGSGKAE